jgi:hypothetical protein
MVSIFFKTKIEGYYKKNKKMSNIGVNIKFQLSHCHHIQLCQLLQSECLVLHFGLKHAIDLPKRVSIEQKFEAYGPQAFLHCPPFL